MTEHQNQDRQPRRDVLADLEARIDAAVEEARPKLKRAFEELEARVDAAVKEVRPRVDEAMDDVRPRVDRLVADAQPRLDSVLQKIQAKIAELRKDLEDRAARTGREQDPDETNATALPRPDDPAGAAPGPDGTP